jgi:hypothetical protein
MRVAVIAYYNIPLRIFIVIFLSPVFNDRVLGNDFCQHNWKEISQTVKLS